MATKANKELNAKRFVKIPEQLLRKLLATHSESEAQELVEIFEGNRELISLDEQLPPADTLLLLRIYDYRGDFNFVTGGALGTPGDYPGIEGPYFLIMVGEPHYSKNTPIPFLPISRRATRKPGEFPKHDAYVVSWMPAPKFMQEKKQ